MISTLPADCLISTLSRLEKSKHINFRITGSRFFKTMEECSDWDFFTKDSDATKEFLKSIGFRSTVTYKADPTISTVFQWGESFSSELVHIQLILPEMILIKEKAQQIIKDCQLVSHDKSVMYATWQAVIATLLAQQTESPVHS